MSIILQIDSLTGKIAGAGYGGRSDPRYFRPPEVETLLGDVTGAKQKNGWVPELTAEQMCAEMLAHDLAEVQQHALLKQLGCKIPLSAASRLNLGRSYMLLLLSLSANLQASFCHSLL